MSTGLRQEHQIYYLESVALNSQLKLSLWK